MGTANSPTSSPSKPKPAARAPLHVDTPTQATPDSSKNHYPDPTTPVSDGERCLLAIATSLTSRWERTQSDPPSQNRVKDVTRVKETDDEEAERSNTKLYTAMSCAADFPSMAAAFESPRPKREKQDESNPKTEKETTHGPQENAENAEKRSKEKEQGRRTLVNERGSQA
jgi:hypothetical protein